MARSLLVAVLLIAMASARLALAPAAYADGGESGHASGAAKEADQGKDSPSMGGDRGSGRPAADRSPGPAAASGHGSGGDKKDEKGKAGGAPGSTGVAGRQGSGTGGGHGGDDGSSAGKDKPGTGGPGTAVGGPGRAQGTAVTAAGDDHADEEDAPAPARRAGATAAAPSASSPPGRTADHGNGASTRDSAHAAVPPAAPAYAVIAPPRPPEAPPAAAADAAPALPARNAAPEDRSPAAGGDTAPTATGEPVDHTTTETEPDDGPTVPDAGLEPGAGEVAVSPAELPATGEADQPEPAVALDTVAGTDEPESDPPAEPAPRARVWLLPAGAGGLAAFDPLGLPPAVVIDARVPAPPPLTTTEKGAGRGDGSAGAVAACLSALALLGAGLRFLRGFIPPARGPSSRTYAPLVPPG